MPQTLKAVHDDDLDSVLEKLGIFSKFKAGQLKCAFCGDAMNFENLHSIFADSGSTKLSCTKPECVVALMSKLEGKKYE